jgi:RimJ/RimL family protein N-acetyltransferase
MDVRSFVDQTWADAFGITVEALREPGTRVVADAPWLAGYRGIYVLRIGNACIVAPPPDFTERVREQIGLRGPDEVYTPDAVRDLAADDATLVLGPSVHSYLDARTFVAQDECDARPLSSGDRPAVDAFRADLPDAEWSEGGFGSAFPYSDVVWGCFEDGRLVAMGNMTDFAGKPADVGLVTHPEVRGRGHGTRLAGAMTAAMLPSSPVIRYRALESNAPSRRVARKLGFADHGSNIAVRLRA